MIKATINLQNILSLQQQTFVFAKFYALHLSETISMSVLVCPYQYVCRSMSIKLLSILMNLWGLLSPVTQFYIKQSNKKTDTIIY